jgi:hypothetical protein
MIGEQSKTTSTGCQIDKIIFDQLVVGTVRIGTVDAGTPDRRDPTSIQNQVRPESKVNVEDGSFGVFGLGHVRVTKHCFVCNSCFLGLCE